ncbi:MAG: hypothetical protein RBT78_09400 [Kiritimatiellia bacterium]|nr:hypothetical protein [Kiritimatiellia bacterium]
MRGAVPCSAGCGALLLLVAAGCVSTNVSTDRALASLRAGDDPQALLWSEKLKRSVYSKPLGFLETGRVRMLSGDFLGSSTNFGPLLDSVIATTETGPVVKLGSVGANVLAGTVTDDRTRAYDVPAYEFVQALQYQMLNHLFLGKPDAAAVEARRAVFAQDQIAEKYGKEVQDARVQAEASQSNQIGKVDAQLQNMAPVLEMTRSSFENGLVWYLSGALLEEQGDQANAAVAFRKAWELSPGNPYVQKDFLRLLRTQDAEQFKVLAAQAQAEPQTLTRARTEILLLIEEGFVPQRQSVKVPLPVGTAVVSVDFPMYREGPHTPLAVEVREKDRTFGMSALALSVQSLAYRDLKERIPGIVVRNVTRAAVRVAAQEVARAQGNDGLSAAVFLVSAVATAINRADTRAWYTLPVVSHLFRGGVEPGEHVIELRNPVNGFVTRVPVRVAEGETRLVWVADLGGNARVATASLNGKGAPATFRVCGSLLAGYPPVTLPGGPRTLGAAQP